MKKICFLISTRGNYAKTYTVIKPLFRKSRLQYIIGGNCPSMRLYGPKGNIVVSEPIDKSAVIILGQTCNYLKHFDPDIVVITGDRFECLPVAMAAYYQRIPIAHIEGGEVSGSIDEGIRHAVSKLASVHFTATESAARRLVRMGERPETIFNVGATSLDMINRYRNEEPMTKPPYILAIWHPVVSGGFEAMKGAVEDIDMDTVWITPNIDDGAAQINKFLYSVEGRVYSDVKVEDFAPLLANASCIVGNSSCGVRESSFLGVPAVNIGDRQKNRIKSENTIDVPCETNLIKSAILKQIDHGRYRESVLYGFGDSGAIIAEILLNNEFETQKVFYDLGDNTSPCRKQGSETQEHKASWWKTTLHMGACCSD